LKQGHAHVLRPHGRGEQLFGRNDLGNFPHEHFPLIRFLFGFTFANHFLLFLPNIKGIKTKSGKDKGGSGKGDNDDGGEGKAKG
jgi:hypothetical protein